MGYKSTRAQLLSVPPYAVAAVVTITVGFIADRTRMRGELEPKQAGREFHSLTCCIQATVTCLWLCSVLSGLPCFSGLANHMFNMPEPSSEQWGFIRAFRTRLVGLRTMWKGSINEVFPWDLSLDGETSTVSAPNAVGSPVGMLRPRLRNCFFQYLPRRRQATLQAGSCGRVGIRDCLFAGRKHSPASAAPSGEC